MADEWWNSARTGGDDTSACSTAPATESAARSCTSMNFQPDLPDTAAAAASSSFLADPHMDWTQAYMGGKAAAGEATSFNALLQLQGDGSHHFLLDGEEPLAPAPYVDGTVVAASQAGVSLYTDNQYASSASGYAFSQLLKSSAPSAQHHQHQQFPGFFSSSGLFGPSPEPPQLLLQAVEPKPVKDLKVQSNMEPVQDACSSVTRSVPDSPAAVKKPRIATPSPLPTFKVRKEKLGDRITALQQLVSPFGKTDTASVLHEAIEYIKFLHDQVASLSSPYLRCRRPVQLQHQQARDGGEEQQDLRSRGLCLVPVSSCTVASETAPEFWYPTFGGTFQ